MGQGRQRRQRGGKKVGGGGGRRKGGRGEGGKRRRRKKEKKGITKQEPYFLCPRAGVAIDVHDRVIGAKVNANALSAALFVGRANARELYYDSPRYKKLVRGGRKERERERGGGMGWGGGSQREDGWDAHTHLAIPCLARHVPRFNGRFALNCWIRDVLSVKIEAARPTEDLKGGSINKSVA